MINYSILSLQSNYNDMERNINLSALVLRKADYGDYDRMITLLTAERGKVEAIVRGCRRSKSELINAAEPFVCGQYQLYFAHERYSVNQCRVTDGFYPLRESFERLSVGAKWLKLLNTFGVPGDPMPEVFEMALSALSYLSYTDIDPALLDAMFKMKLLYISGFYPSTDKCAVCGKGNDETVLGFDAQKGGCVCSLCAPNAEKLSEGARRILNKAPKTPYKSVEKLIPRPEWPEAAERIREFTDYVAGR